MQETNEFSLNATTSFNGLVPLNPLMTPGLFAPYKQQTNNLNLMMQNQMTVELHKQLMRLEQRAVFCLKMKDKDLEETKKRHDEMEIRLRKALAEAEFWKKTTAQKTEVCKDLAGRLIDVRRKELFQNKNVQMKFTQDAESSTGDNGDDVDDTGRSRKGKRQRR